MTPVLPKRALGVLVAASLSGCQAGDKLPLYEAGHWGLTGATSGRLAFDGPCLRLKSRDGSVIHLVWPDPGTAWDAETEEITVHGVTATVGDEVTVSGGAGGGADGVAGLGDWVSPPPPECLDGPQWFVTRFDP